ncbi:MAG TPA: hypothetical protein VH482_10355 [Thermomicrobiales bacterium]
MATSNTRPSVSRRTALAGLGTGGLGLALAAGSRGAAAQDTASEMAKHPIVGVWMATTRTGPAPSIFSPDGTVTIARPVTQAGPQGVVFVSSEVGTWEPTSARGVHFTSVHLQSDANGTYTGSVTIDGHPTVSEDGQTFVDDSPDSGPTIRDAAGNVVAAPRGQPPVTGIRMGVGSPGFPAGTPTAGTPTA